MDARAVNEFLSGLVSPNTVPRLREFHDKVRYLITPDTAQYATNGSARRGE